MKVPPDGAQNKPAGPDFVTVAELKRGDGWTKFARKDSAGKWHPVLSLHRDEFANMLPGMVHELAKDAFFTLNTFWRPGTAKKEDVRWLESCFADLDCYKPPNSLTPATAIGHVLEYVERGRLPMPSVFVRSGQGLWLLWVLQDAKGQPLRNYARNRRWWEALQAALATRVPGMGPDSSAFTDTARHIRVPCSIHTAANKPVYYAVMRDGDGKPFTYRLSDLAQQLDIPRPPRPTRRRTLKPGSRPDLARGPRTVAERRLADALRIERRGGGFALGKRRLLLYYVARFAKRAGKTQDEALALLDELARRCRPPYPSTAGHAESHYHPSPATIVKQTWTGKSGLPRDLHNAVLAEHFHVSPQLAVDLALKSIRPRNAPAANAARPAELRRAAIVAHLDEHPGKVPTAGDMAQHLAAQGFKASRATVQRDYLLLEQQRVIHRLR